MAVQLFFLASFPEAKAKRAKRPRRRRRRRLPACRCRKHPGFCCARHVLRGERAHFDLEQPRRSCLFLTTLLLHFHLAMADRASRTLWDVGTAQMNSDEQEISPVCLKYFTSPRVRRCCRPPLKSVTMQCARNCVEMAFFSNSLFIICRVLNAGQAAKQAKVIMQHT